MPHQKPITKPLNLKLPQPIPEDIITSNFHSAPYFPRKIKLFQGGSVLVPGIISPALALSVAGKKKQTQNIQPDQAFQP